MDYKIFIALTLVQSLFAGWAQKTLQQMTLDEKLGQLFIVKVNNSDFEHLDKKSNKAEEVQDEIINSPQQVRRDQVKNLIEKYKIGGIHLVCFGTIQSCYKAIKKFQTLSKLPLLISQDFEWGLGMRLKDAISFPRNMTLGAIKDNNLLYEKGKEIARQCKLLGVHINFGPVIDINTNPLNPVINDRSFGDNKENITEKALKIMQGLQDGGIIACAKHFPGHGDTNLDSHKDLPIIKHSLSRIKKIELYPFQKLISNGVKAIMSAHINVPAIDNRLNRTITFSKKGITDLLKKEYGFKGLVITDDLDMKAITKFFKPEQIAIEAFLAGNDMFIMSIDIEKAIESLKKAIINGFISEKELDEKVLKILKIKEDLGINKNRFAPTYKYKNFFPLNAKKLNFKLFESAITIAKNEENLIPIKNNYISLNIFKDSQISKLKKQLNSKTKNVVVNLSDINKNDHNMFGLSKEILDFLNSLNKTKKVILVIFGSPYSLKLFNNFKTIIIAYQENEITKPIIPKIISGKIQTSGNLPIKI